MFWRRHSDVRIGPGIITLSSLVCIRHGGRDMSLAGLMRRGLCDIFMTPSQAISSKFLVLNWIPPPNPAGIVGKAICRQKTDAEITLLGVGLS